ncbi:hypothetical protein [Bdellovibrio sp. HCB209]|uniref:hypothetical protein n=1 Tax=Bdellovibrio sp. HCB209 TaxID=3394354 RepID=UPI0039B48D87
MAIVRGDKFVDLLNTVLADENIDREYKAFFAVCLSGGLRVSEGLALTKANFIEDDGCLFFKVSVLKKRRHEERWCRVHPAAQSFVKEVLATKVGTLFDWDPSTCLRRIKRHFQVEGICNHSLRHSAISYYLFEEKRTKEETAKLCHVSSKIIDTYAHLDERKVLKEMFKGAR